MTSDDPGPGQKYAIMARKHIAALRAKEPGVKIEIRWNGTRWLTSGQNSPLTSQMPTEWSGSISGTRAAKSERESSPSRDLWWAEAKGWAKRRLDKTKNRKYHPSEKQKPDPTVANKRLPSRFYELKTGHCLTGQNLAWTTRCPDASCWRCQYKIQTREHLFKNCPQWNSQQKTLWTTVKLEETRKLPGPTRGKDRTKIAELFADERCSQALLDFVATTDVGRTTGPPVVEDVEAAASEASEWTVGNARSGSL